MCMRAATRLAGDLALIAGLVCTLARPDVQSADRAPVVTAVGAPLHVGPVRMAVVRHPGNLFLELIQRAPQ
jgi:hypothetical protein